jgi:hypothetical protein
VFLRCLVVSPSVGELTQANGEGSRLLLSADRVAPATAGALEPSGPA